ncbi:MAG: TIGR03085 family metal-binding protein [Mycobacterium sp.]
MSAAQQERAALVETMRSVGPDAPTLCEGWTTRDLAAHLVIRERRPDAAPGILVPALASYTARVQQKAADSSDWTELLDKIASGPPIFSALKLLDPLVNLNEMFIHHEDVRRAQPGWEPRALDAETVKALARPLPVMARLTMAKVPARVALRTPDGTTLVSVGRGPAVTVIGAPEELLLFAVGRDARVTFDGDDDAIRAVREGRRGL